MAEQNPTKGELDPEKHEREEQVAETVRSILLIIEKVSDISAQVCTEGSENHEKKQIDETILLDTGDSGDHSYSPTPLSSLPKPPLDFKECSVTSTPEDMETEMDYPAFDFTKQSSAILEKVAISVVNKEPILLVGETGTEKIPVVEYLAYLTERKLTVINMRQPSDSVDSATGYESIDLVFAVKFMKEKFMKLFTAQRIVSVDVNTKFLGHFTTCLERKRYDYIPELILHAQKNLVNGLLKRQKRSTSDLEQLHIWTLFGEEIHTLKHQMKLLENTLFKFIEGPLIKAMKNGEWLLLDEINICEAEIIQNLASILEKENTTLFLRGDKNPLVIHENFRLFISMNVNSQEKDLPLGIKNSCKEIHFFDVEELEDKDKLVQRLQGLKKVTIEDIVKCFSSIKEVSRDDAGHYPDNRADTVAGDEHISEEDPRCPS